MCELLQNELPNRFPDVLLSHRHPALAGPREPSERLAPEEPIGEDFVGDGFSQTRVREGVVGDLGVRFGRRRRRDQRVECSSCGEEVIDAFDDRAVAFVWNDEVANGLRAL